LPNPFFACTKQNNNLLANKQLDNNDTGFVFNNFIIHKSNKSIFSNFEVLDRNKTLKLYTSHNFNLNTNKLTGRVVIDKLINDKLKNINGKSFYYNTVFNDITRLNIPTYGLQFTKYGNDNYKLDINKPLAILKFIDKIKITKNIKNKKSKIVLIGNSRQIYKNIIIDNLNMDINSSLFKSNNKNDHSIKDHNSSLNLPALYIQYTNSKLKYDGKYLLPFDKLNIKTNKSNIDMTIKSGKANIKLKYNKDLIAIDGNLITGELLNSVINNNIFEGGYINFRAYGQSLDMLSGDTKFHDINIKNVSIVNNLISFVNTTPAIINPLLALPTLYRMAENGFDTNGYYINYGDGTFRYSVPLQQMNLYDLYTNGKMANFIVNSSIDIKNDKLNATVDIEFLKDHTAVINAIPIIGYILTGDDGTISTSVDIKGTLEEQEIKTNTIKDALTGVYGIFKRLITLPFKPFLDNDNETNK